MLINFDQDYCGGGGVLFALGGVGEDLGAMIGFTLRILVYGFMGIVDISSNPVLLLKIIGEHPPLAALPI